MNTYEQQAKDKANDVKKEIQEVLAKHSVETYVKWGMTLIKVKVKDPLTGREYEYSVEMG